MSKLEELIKEFCPNGVISVTIGKICKISRGIVMSKDFIRDNHGDYPVYSSQTENNGCLGYINTYKYDGEYVTWTTDGANAGTVFYRSGKFSITNVCGLLEVKDLMVVNTKYLYYALSIEARRYVNQGMGNPKLMSNIMASVQIPLPALPVQREIVRILDSFTLYSAELTAELTARRKQYEFYRDKLLTFDDLSSKVEAFTIEDICKTITDFTAAGSFADIAKNVVYKSTPDFARLVRTMDIKSNFTKGEPVYVDENAFKYLWRVNFDQDCIILPNIGANCGEAYYVGKGTLPYQNNVLGPNAIMLKNISCNVRYLYHLLLLSDFQNDLRRIISPGGQTKFNKTELKKIKIKIPPMEVQERIVRVLDNFDAICSDLGIGLPAEIEKRQKQYEYYREKLLTFDGKYATILTERNGTERNGTERNGTERNGTERNGTERAD